MKILRRRIYEVAMLIVKHFKPFTEAEFIKECVMKMVENMCLEKKQEFANVSLGRSTVALKKFHLISRDS